MAAARVGLLTEQIIRGKTRLERLDEVRNLNLWGQDLDDVSIVQRLTNVEVLSLSVNRINSLRDFRHCLHLKELYLRKNDIADVTEILSLIPLKQLTTLWLCDNPCADHPLYRQIVARALPSVDKLDNSEITDMEREAAARNPEVTRLFASLPDDARPGGRLLPPPPSSSGQYGGGQPPAGYSQGAAPSPRGLTSPNGSPAGYSGGGGPPPYGGGGGPGPYGGGPPPPYGGMGAGNGPMPRGRKNILYAVMALVTELDEDDLVYVKREIEQRLGSMGR